MNKIRSASKISTFKRLIHLHLQHWFPLKCFCCFVMSTFIYFLLFFFCWAHDENILLGWLWMPIKVLLYNSIVIWLSVGKNFQSISCVISVTISQLGLVITPQLTCPSLHAPSMCYWQTSLGKLYVGTNLVQIKSYIVWRNMKRIALYLLAWAKSSTISVYNGKAFHCSLVATLSAFPTWTGKPVVHLWIHLRQLHRRERYSLQGSSPRLLCSLHLLHVLIWNDFDGIAKT